MPRLLLPLLLLLLPLVAMGAESAETPRSLQPESLNPTVGTQVGEQLVPELRAAMFAELRSRIADDQQETASLMAEWKNAPSGAARLAVERRIHVAREAAWLDLMRIQAKYARLDGEIEIAETIEAKIAEVENPAPRQADVKPVVERKPSMVEVKEVQR